jgi:hypothetical protein
MSTFFARIVRALDRDKVDAILREQAGVDTTGMVRRELDAALIKADGNGVATDSNAIRTAIIEYVGDVL